MLCCNNSVTLTILAAAQVKRAKYSIDYPYSIRWSHETSSKSSLYLREVNCTTIRFARLLRYHKCALKDNNVQWDVLCESAGCQFTSRNLEYKWVVKCAACPVILKRPFAQFSHLCRGFDSYGRRRYCMPSAHG